MILSLDIDHGDIFIHFWAKRVSITAWNPRTKSYRNFTVPFDRAVSIAAKAIRGRRLVEPFNFDGDVLEL